MSKKLPEEEEFLSTLEGKRPQEIAVEQYKKLLEYFMEWNHHKRTAIAFRAQTVLKRVYPYIKHELGN